MIQLVFSVLGFFYLNEVQLKWAIPCLKAFSISYRECKSVNPAAIFHVVYIKLIVILFHQFKTLFDMPTIYYFQYSFFKPPVPRPKHRKIISPCSSFL